MKGHSSDDIRTSDQLATGQPDPDCIYEFGPFQFDPSEPTDRRLLREGIPTHLPQKIFVLLHLLLRNGGRKLTKEELVVELWPDACAKAEGFGSIPSKRRQGYLTTMHQHNRKLRGIVGAEHFDMKKGYGLLTKVTKRPRSQPTPKYEELEFNQWILDPQKRGRITTSLCAAVTLSILYLLFREYLHFVSPIVMTTVIQTVVVAWAFIASFYVFDMSGRELLNYTLRASAKVGLSQYLRYWKFLLLSWLLLYVSLTIKTQLDDKQVDAFGIVSTFFNNCNSLALALCYIALKKPSSFREGTGRRKIRWNKVVGPLGAVAILLFAAIEFRVITGNLTDVDSFTTRVDVVSGIIGGVTLAAYVRLLQRRFLDHNPWLRSLFYLYALIQPLFFIINQFILDQSFWIVEIALILKCLLFLYMSWLFKSGRLMILFGAAEKH